MVSLGTHQDDEARTGEPTVVGPGHRDAKGGSAGRGVGGPGAGSPEEKTKVPHRQEAPSWTARLAAEAPAGARTECPHARDHGDARRGDGWQEDLAARVRESRAPAHAPVCGEPGAQKLPTQETTPRRKEAPPTTRPDQGQARTTSRGASSAASRETGATARETGATGGQTRRRAGTPAREAGAASSQRSRTAGPSVSKTSDPPSIHKRSPKGRGEAAGTSASAGMLRRTLSAACL